MSVIRPYERVTDVPEREAPAEEKTAEKNSADLSVGDIIRYDGKRVDVEEIDESYVKLKDLDHDTFGGVLLAVSEQEL